MDGVMRLQRAGIAVDMCIGICLIAGRNFSMRYNPYFMGTAM
jgi:hypothetical protein